MVNHTFRRHRWEYVFYISCPFEALKDVHQEIAFGLSGIWLLYGIMETCLASELFTFHLRFSIDSFVGFIALKAVCLFCWVHFFTLKLVCLFWLVLPSNRNQPQRPVQPALPIANEECCHVDAGDEFLAAEREAQRQQVPCLCIDLDMDRLCSRFAHNAIPYPRNLLLGFSKNKRFAQLVGFSKLLGN